MQLIASILNFVKAIGGPRSLGILLLCSFAGAFLIYHLLKNSSDRQDKPVPGSRTKTANILIAGLAALLVLGFLAISLLFIYLIFNSR